MFDLDKHRSQYFYDYVTVIDNLLPEAICVDLVARINQIIAAGGVPLVDHQGLGSESVLDAGGRYLHYIFRGPDIREHLPELNAVYHAILPLVSLITLADAVVSPYPQSDINIKVYPPGGGTLGEHRDTNGITVLLFLTTNQEAPLRMWVPRTHPSKPEAWLEERKIYAKAGSLLVMHGREIDHDCEPTVHEQKVSVVLNFYKRGDTWRPAAFDDFVYRGVDPDAKPEKNNTIPFDILAELR
jgi:hypothetical protein